MSLCTVAELRAALGVGTLYPDATLQEVCNAADEIIIPMIWQEQDFAIGHSNTGTKGYLYFDHDITKVFYVGQTVNIDGAGSHFNGNKTIVEVGTYYIQVTTNHVTDAPYHGFGPYATISYQTQDFDYTASAAIQTAALLISVDIWQARQVSSTGGTSPDFTPAPYRLGNTLLARVRSLLAPYLAPNSMIG